MPTPMKPKAGPAVCKYWDPASRTSVSSVNKRIHASGQRTLPTPISSATPPPIAAPSQAIGGGVAELIGVGSVLWPEAWIRLFTEDTDVLLAGSQYLHTAGPAFGFIGVGMLLYFASQGAGCMLW